MKQKVQILNKKKGNSVFLSIKKMAKTTHVFI
jgi:hypothetical protein